MSEDTPDTEHVRAQFARMENFDPYYEGDLYLTPDGQLSAQKFDRWLAEHDAEVAMAERDRIMDLIGDGAAYLIAKGDLGSATLVAVGKLEDLIKGDNE